VEPLVVEFLKPMDYALLQRMIEVQGVAGRIVIDRDETRWSFAPDAPWKAGSYHLIADNLLEDIAGNHLDARSTSICGRKQFRGGRRENGFVAFQRSLGSGESGLNPRVTDAGTISQRPRDHETDCQPSNPPIASGARARYTSFSSIPPPFPDSRRSTNRAPPNARTQQPGAFQHFIFPPLSRLRAFH